MKLHPQLSTLFPYTTLFRSGSPMSPSRPAFATRTSRSAPRGSTTTGTGSSISSSGITFNGRPARSEEHTSELQSHSDLVCRLLLEKKKKDVLEEYEALILPA